MGKLYSQLSEQERLEIWHLKRLGRSFRWIAKALDRSVSTITREWHRNGRSHSSWRGGYDPIRAHRLARRRRQVDKSRFKLVRQPDLLEYVVDRLAMGWSPQQIAGRLTREHGAPVISHESIYRYIYYRRKQKDYLCRLLPEARSRRRPRQKPNWYEARIPDRCSIRDRPAHVRDRHEGGHWEADLMAFSTAGVWLLVTCERASRFLMVRQLADRTSTAVIQDLSDRFADMPPHWRRSVTFDNGTEFWQHNQLTKSYQIQTWFCDPRSPWQKGSVENAIRRLRRWLPRKTDPKSITPDTIKEIINAYNNTPRACLGYKTPAETVQGISVALQS